MCYTFKIKNILKIIFLTILHICLVYPVHILGYPSHFMSFLKSSHVLIVYVYDVLSICMFALCAHSGVPGEARRKSIGFPKTGVRNSSYLPRVLGT